MKNAFRGVMAPILMGVAVLAAIIALMPIAAEAHESGPGPVWPEQAQAVGPAEEGPAIGPQVVIDGGADVELGGTGSRLPRIALSTDNSYLAIVYQQGTTILLRSNDGVNGWANAAIVGTGEAPALAFTGPNTAHVVWLDSTRNQIFQASCALTATAANCTALAPINLDENETLESPAIVYSNPYLYVAWINTADNQAITARSSTNGGSWDFNFVSASNLSGSTTALAAAGGRVHLAFVHNNGAFIRYRNASAAVHVWGNGLDFSPGANYNKVSNPALAANGTSVYLSWDASTLSQADRYVLLGILGSVSLADGVVTWPDSFEPRHISSNVLRDSGTTGDQKWTRSTGGATPLEEAGLRPSLAVSGTNFVAVWQERPLPECVDTEPAPENGTSEIYYAEAAKPGLGPVGNWWVDRFGTLADDITFYTIDPDIAVNSTSQVRHIVFMKASIFDSSQCAAGGSAVSYTISYRGPGGAFSVIQNPPTPTPTPPGGPGGLPSIYLPILFKG
jgi:hypothetical protein